MTPILASIVAFAAMLLGAAAAPHLRRILADRHFTEAAKDIVRLSANLMATLAALVLSLLISSANSAYEAQRRELRQIVATAVLMDSLLEKYGPAARPARERMRRAMHVLADSIWHRGSFNAPEERGYIPRDVTRDLHEAIHALAATDDRQRELRAEILQLSVATAQARYVLYEGTNTSLPTPFLVILIGWLAALFMSFCLFSPPNRIAVVALVILALSTASALFLLLELGTPFTGLLALPEASVRNALPPLPPA